MPTRNSLQPYLVRLILIFIVCLVGVALFNEIVFRLQREEHDRSPQTIQLVIPPGAAQQVAAGEPVTEIPEEMVFVVGDVLEVVNQDTVDHQLGPIWVPAGSTGRLNMDKADNLAYSCSFQETRYLGLDVREPTTLSTRLLGLSIAAPTMTALIFIYSLAAWPVKPAARKARSVLPPAGGSNGSAGPSGA